MIEFMYASAHDPDMLYAIRTDASDPVFWLRREDGREYIFLDHREIGIFTAENKNPALEAVLSNPLIEEAGGNAMLLAGLILERYGKGKEVVVPRNFPLDIADGLREKGHSVSVRHPFFPKRARKTDEEADVIRETIRKTGAAFARIEGILGEAEIKADGVAWRGELVTSELLKAEAEIALIHEGLADVEGMIVSCEAHSAVPHHRGEGLILPHAPIVCDIFPRDRASGYHADVTRTYVKGAPSAGLQKMYDAVLLAQTRAIAAIRPGVPGKEIHDIAVATFAELGYHPEEGRGFIHGTGHGVGLAVHELPVLGSSPKEILEPGNVVTVEPGLYYPELGGVRIEDVVLVTESGAENLTLIPKRFVIG